MSEDEIPATGGQQHNASAATEEHDDANDSIIQKVKSRVSSIFPQSLGKWFSPTATNPENSRNGNLRRRREESCGEDRQENSDDSDDDDGFERKNKRSNLAMPPTKRSRWDEGLQAPVVNSYQNLILSRNKKIVSSTPMVGIRNRKPLPAYDFTGASTGIITSPSTSRIRFGTNYEDTPDIIEVVPELEKTKVNFKGSSSILKSHHYPSMNRSTTSRQPTNLFNSSSLAKKPKILTTTTYNVDDTEEGAEENDELDDEDEIEEDDDDDEEIVNAEIRNAQQDLQNISERKSQTTTLISNGLRVNTPNVIITRNEGQDTASESGESQCSSIIQQRSKAGLFNPNFVNPGTSSKRSSSMANSINFYSHLEGKKSLFSTKNMYSILNNSTMSLTSLNRRQQFNASLYGSTSALSDSRLLNTTSPFYKGRTTYGGASAYSQSLMSSSARQIRVTPTFIRPTSSLSNSSQASQDLSNSNAGISGRNTPNNISGTAAISTTAKRILELMDQFTTPLSEAKKMANTMKNTTLLSNKKRFTEADLLASRRTINRDGIRLQKPGTPYSRPYLNETNIQNSSSSILPPVNELQVPSMAQLLQLKKLLTNTERNREVASSNSKSILNKKEDYKLPNQSEILTGSNKHATTAHSGKIKTKTNITRQPVINKNDNELPEKLNLPNIQLPVMKSVPKIDIHISNTSISTGSTAPKQTLYEIKNTTNSNKFSRVEQRVKKSPTFEITGRPSISSVSKSISERSSPNNNKNNNSHTEFKFSTPIKVNTPKDKSYVDVSINNFKFSPPTSVNKNINKTMVDNFEYQSHHQKESPKDTDFGGSKSKDFSGKSSSMSIQSPATGLYKGSVLDALKKPLSTNIEGELYSLPSNRSEIKSVDSNKNLTDWKKTETTSKSSNEGFGNQFKKTVNQWECSACMIRNDNTRDKCVACETPKKSPSNQDLSTPSLSSTNIIPPLTTSTKISKLNPDLFKSKENTWECETCMIRNKNEQSICLACKSPKPGSTKINELIKNASATTPSLVTTDSGFIDIVAKQKSSKWECTACMTRNDSNRSKCICCEQGKPGETVQGTSAPPKFSFGFASNSSTNKPNILGSSTVESKMDSGFKDIVAQQKASKWECTSCMTRNDSNLTKCICCAQAKPGVDVHPSTSSTTPPKFTFGFASNKLVSPAESAKNNLTEKNEDEKKSKTTDVTTDVTKKTTGGFIFGSQVPSTSSGPSAGFSFGIKPTTNSPVVPANKDLTDTSSGFTFGTSPKPESTNNTKKSAEFSFGIKPAVEGTSSETSKPTETNANTSKTSESFKFGSSSSSSTNIFTAPAEKTGGFSFCSPKPVDNKNEIEQKNKLFNIESKNEISPADKTGGFSIPKITGNQVISTMNSSPVLSSISASSFGQEKSLNNAGDFSLGSSAPPTSSITLPSATQASSFVFGGKLPTSTSSPTPVFGIVSTSTPSLGSINNVPVSTVSTFSSSITSTTSIFGSSASNKNAEASNICVSSPSTIGASSAFGTSGSLFNVPKSPAAAPSTSAQQESGSKLFQFGSNKKIDEPSQQKIFGSPSTGLNTANKPFSFGQSTETLATPITSANVTTPFVFGVATSTSSTVTSASNIAAVSPSPSTSLFGQVNYNNTFGSSTFGSSNIGAQSSSTAVFGQTTPMTSLFGSASSEQQQQQKATPTFGSSANLSVTPIFGSALPVGRVAVPGMHGAFLSDLPAFGSSTFGSSTSNTSGSFSMPSSHDVSAAKKPSETPFNFGAPAQNTQSGFSGFSNNNNNTAKPAFNFTAQAAPTFNFTGTTEATNSSQPFQFGALTNTATVTSVFNFGGTETTPNAPFTFSAPTNNIFAPNPTPGTQSSQQARRKIRSSTTRRIPPR